MLFSSLTAEERPKEFLWPFHLLKYKFARVPRKKTKSIATMTPAAHPKIGANLKSSSPASFKTVDMPHSAVAENPSAFRLRSKLFFFAR